MHARWVVLSLIVGAAAPLALAHTPAGTPKNYCEPPSDWSVHDYGPVASGRLLYGNEDGNIGGDCDPGFSFDPGYVCLGVDPEDPISSFLVGLCDADLNPPLADWDGHNEFAFGGAWLLVNSGAGVPSADPTVGAGTLYCFGAPGHHPNFGPVTVEDVVLDALGPPLGYAVFTVASDTIDLTGTGEGCGDFQSDQSIGCHRSCFTVPFPPGLDGAYVVFVEGTFGHVHTDFGIAPEAARPGPTLGSGGTMQFDGSGGEPQVSEAPGWDCEGPFQVGGEWEIQCSPIGTGAAVNRVFCTSPYAVAGGTPVSFGTASVAASCRNGFATGCSTSWLGAGACLAPPPLALLDSFPLHCRAQVIGSTIGGTLFASCGNLA